MRDAESGSGASGDTPAYCSSCGSELDPDDRYCSSCGQEAGDSAGSQEREGLREDAELREFRQRVGDYLNNGWEIEHDAGEEVVLADRGIGSIGIHVLLVLFTGGVGNLLYGWYHYSYDADQIVIRAGEKIRPLEATERGPATDAGAATEQSRLGGYVFGLLLLLTGIYVIGTSLASFGGILAGLGLMLISLLLLPPTRRRLRDRYPPTTFGPTETVDEHAVSKTDQLCSICRERVDDGVRREFTKEYVVAGIPLYTMEAGENTYCDSCHRERHSFDIGTERFDGLSEEVMTDDTFGDGTTDKRTTDSETAGEEQSSVDEIEPEVEPEIESEFEDETG